jgi:hypothetical protein
MSIKKCSKCNIVKILSDFYNNNGYCKACSKIQSLNHAKKNKYKYQKNWNKDNETVLKEQINNWKEKNKGYWNEYQKQRRKDDPYYSLYINLRSRISNLLSGKSKSKRTQHIIGLTLTEFKQHIESKWSERMNWNNYGAGDGKWVLDHKMPISTAKDKNDIITLNHYTNLQPMWWRENLEKSDKII